MTQPERTRDAEPGTAGQPESGASDDMRGQPAPGTPEYSGTDQRSTGEQPSGDDGGDEKAKLIKESTSRKHKIREVEAERDRLRARVETMQAADAERLASSGEGARLHRGGDLWVHGTRLGDLLNDDGDVDPARVTEAVERVTDGREYLRADRTRPKPDPSQGAREGVPSPPQRLGAIFTQQPPRR